MGGSSQMQDMVRGASSSWTPQQQGLADSTGVIPFNQYGDFGQPPSTGQTGLFSSLGQDPTNSMRMQGNMLTSTPPTGGGTMQPLVGAGSVNAIGPSSQIGPLSSSGLGSPQPNPPATGGMQFPPNPPATGGMQPPPNPPAMGGDAGPFATGGGQPPPNPPAMGGQGGWFSGLQSIIEELMGGQRA